MDLDESGKPLLTFWNMMGEVVSVQAMSSTALVDIEAEDTAVVILGFKNGALGALRRQDYALWIRRFDLNSW